MPIGGICWTKRQTPGPLVTSAGLRNTSPACGEVPTAAWTTIESDGWRRPGAARQRPHTSPRQMLTAWMPIGGVLSTSKWRFFFPFLPEISIAVQALVCFLFSISPNSAASGFDPKRTSRQNVIIAVKFWSILACPQALRLVLRAARAGNWSESKETRGRGAGGRRGERRALLPFPLAPLPPRRFNSPQFFRPRCFPK